MSVHHGHHPVLWLLRQDWRYLPVAAAILVVGTAWTAGWLR